MTQGINRYIGTKTAVCFGMMLLSRVLSISTSFAEEQYKPPASELQIHPFCIFGTGRADASLNAINPPDGLAFTKNGLLLATDAMNHRVQIFDPYSGKHLGSIGNSGVFEGEIVGILVLPDKGLLISDEKVNQVYRFEHTAISPVAFQPVPPPLLKGERFKRLCGMTSDSKGRIYIVDGITGQVRRYLPDFKPDPSWKFKTMRPDHKPFLNRAEGIAIYEPSGTIFLSSDRDGMICAFDLETGAWKGKTIGRKADALTGAPIDRSVFSRSVEGLAIMDGYLLAVDEGEISATRNFPGHLLIFDLRKDANDLVGWFGSYVSPDAVAVFPGSAKHPEPLIAVANQGAYEVLVYKWKEIKNEIVKARADTRIP